jgi:hypothetical protein
MIRVSLGVSVAAGWIVEPEPGRYLGTLMPGQAIDRGLGYIIFSISLGVLVEMCYLLASIRDKV